MQEQSILPVLGVSAGALDAQAQRMRLIASNLANAHTTQDADGNVYRRRHAVFAEALDRRMTSGGRRDSGLRGVQVDHIAEDQSSLQRLYRPGHPQADADGYVTLPNVNPMEEMVDMMSASRAYEANVAAIRAAKSMAAKALEVGR